MGWLLGDSPKSQMDLVNRQVDQAEKRYNDYLSMVRGMVEGSGYDFFAPKTTRGTSQSTSSTNFNQFTRPEILPDYKVMEGLFRNIVESRLKHPTGLPHGYAENAARATNKTYAGATQAAKNIAARRGLSGEATLGLVSPIESARAGDIADLLVEIPLKERQMRTEDIQLAQALTDMFGKGMRTSGTSTTNTRGSSTSTSPASINEFLGYLGLLSPFDRPLVVPEPRQGILGSLLGHGAQFLTQRYAPRKT